MHRILLVTLFVLGACELFAKDIFVGGAGASDNNPGTAAQPFATIQKAASVAVSGDVVKIRSGIYRETIVVASSGITFRPDAGASVTISGFNVIDNTGWTVHSGNIYKKSITLPVNGFNTSTSGSAYPGNTNILANQILRNGEMMFQARYPNIDSFDDLMKWQSYKQYNYNQGFKASALTDAALPTNPGSLVGGTIVSNGWYDTFASTITGHDMNGSGGVERVTYSPAIRDDSDPGQWMREAYYITNKLGLLDVEQEWHYENGTLYFWQPGGGTPTGTIEYKARNWGFDIRGRSGFKVIGLTFIGVDPVIGDAASTNAVIEKTKATFNNHVVRHDVWRWNGCQVGMAYMLGTKLLGANSVFKDNEWSKAASILLWMGPNTVADNNLLHDSGYAGNSGGAISVWAQDGGQKIIRNTIYNQGRGGLYFGYVERGHHDNMEVAWNEFYDYGTINSDGGATYAGDQTIMAGLNMHHNWFHGHRSRKTPNKGGLNGGIYFDQGSGGGNGAVVHHNVVWDNMSGDIYHLPIYNGFTNATFNIYNNTFASTEAYGGAEHSYKTPSTSPLDVMRNNIYVRRILINWEAGNVGNNQNYVYQYAGTDPQFVGTGGGGLNYRIKSTSPAKDKGIVISGITDGSVGTPDIGAYEYGGEDWVPGYTPVPFVNPGTNTPPTGAITAPANNATFTQGSAITVTASANDADGSVAKVEFFSGTTKLGEDATIPYSYVWNGAAAGTHSLTVKVTDDQNNVATSAAVSITVNTNAAPTVAITAPADNAQVQAGTPITITATAADANGTVARVEFFDGTTKIGEDLSSPYSFTWNNAAAGDHSLTAKATDNLGGVATSAAVSITVNAAANTPPTVAITAPGDNSQFQTGATITISATATDANGSVAKVEFFYGTTKIGEDLTVPYSFTWTNPPIGNHSITAKATDNQNSVATSSAMDITVANATPVVSITSPADNARFTVGAPITITATATDAGGTITKVEFFNGTTKLGEDLSSPYSFTWNNAAAGNHSLTAKATDNQNSVTTSAAIDITVALDAMPVVAITAPAKNARFAPGAPITITATATDAGGSITKVEFLDGTTKIGEDLSSPYSFTWNSAALGSHSLTARATDNENNVTTSVVVAITVRTNVKPEVKVTGPATNGRYDVGTPITITATATDTDGSITKVEFFNGTTKLGEDLSSPYSFTWNNAPAGNHSITAKATDNENDFTISAAAVNISVINPVGPTVDAGEDQVLTLPENSVTLIPSVVSTTAVEYNWTQVEGPTTVSISSPTSEQLSLGDLIEGIYVFKLSVTDANGLTSADEIRVTVLAASETTAASIPRFFSPNDDGTGDFWEWTNVEAYENSRLTIYNRAGQQVYEATSYNNTWDGKLDGQPLQDGDYYYVIQLANLTDIKGAVRIIR